MVDNASQIAKLANRVLMVAKQESDNSEDPQFINRLNRAAAELQAGQSFLSATPKCVSRMMENTQYLEA